MREGTLGLLLLTPLNAFAVVTAKATTHAIRAFTLYLTGLPFIAIALLLGGGGLEDLFVAALTNLAVLVLGLGAGLLASALIRDRVGAAVLAVALSVAFGVTLMVTHEFVGLSLVATAAPVVRASGLLVVGGHDADPFASLTHLFMFNADIFPSVYWSSATFSTVSAWLPASTHFQWFVSLSLLVVGTVAFLALIIGSAARTLDRQAKADPPPEWAASMRRTFCEPRFWRKLFRRQMSSSLNRNPIGWLQQYSWRARCVKWLLCIVVVAAESFAVPKSLDWSPMLQSLSIGLLLVSALIASSSFRRERESGAMELLLVAPLSPAQIVLGRLAGCWMQLLPAALILIVSSLMLESWVTSIPFLWDRPALIPSLLFYVGAGLVLPLVGLYFSMWRIKPVSAFVLTTFVGLVLPWLAMHWPRESDFGTQSLWPLFRFVLGQILLATFAGLLLYRKLASRKFVLR